MKNRTSNSRIVKGISFEPEVLEKGKEKARSNRQSLSAYICSLIFFDSNVNNKLIQKRSKEAK